MTYQSQASTHSEPDGPVDTHAVPPVEAGDTGTATPYPGRDVPDRRDARDAEPADADLPDPEPSDVDAVAAGHEVRDGHDGTGTGAPEEMLPGEVSAPAGAVWSPQAIQALRDRWNTAQLGFIDDPAGAARDAGAVVNDAIREYTEALTARRTELDRWQAGQPDDTEVLRTAIRGYRDLFSALVGG